MFFYSYYNKCLIIVGCQEGWRVGRIFRIKKYPYNFDIWWYCTAVRGSVVGYWATR